MGVADTFSLLATLPVEQRLPYVEAALREPFVELQSAAFEALSGPGGLGRPDLVIQHYSDLTAEVRLKVASREPLFRAAAMEELRSPKEWSAGRPTRCWPRCVPARPPPCCSGASPTSPRRARKRGGHA